MTEEGEAGHREGNEAERERYAAAWRRPLMWQRVYSVGLLLIGVLFLGRAVSKSVPVGVLIGVGAVALLGVIAGVYMLDTLECPRCGGRFARRTGRRHPRLRSCSECRLRFGAMPRPKKAKAEE